MATNARSESVFIAQQRVLLPLREAYIELHGFVVKWARQKDAVERRDFYNDVRNDAITTELVDIKVVLTDATVRQLIDVHVNGQNSQQPNIDADPYKAYVSARHEVMKGDLIYMPYELVEPFRTDAEELYYTFRIVDVVKSYHRLAPSKHIMLVPHY